MTEISPSAQRKLVLLSSTFSAFALVGLITTSWHPGRHPVCFSFSLSWVINVVVFQWTRACWFGMDPGRFRLAGWEKEGRIYRWAGVDAFRWLLLRSPLSWLSPALKMAPHRAGMERLLKHLNCAEGVHLASGIVTLGIAGVFIVAGHLAVGLNFAAAILLMHVYPVMLQRRNRGHVLRLLRRLDALRNSPLP